MYQAGRRPKNEQFSRIFTHYRKTSPILALNTIAGFAALSNRFLLLPLLRI